MRPVGRRSGRARRLSVLLALLVFLAATALGARALLYRDEVMPGVEVLGADVAGVAAPEAAVRARRPAAARLNAPVPIRVAGTTVTIRANRVLLLDRRATAAALHGAGRDSLRSRLEALAYPLTSATRIAPVFAERPQARARLSALLAPYVKPPVSARVRMRGTEPLVVAGKPGTTVDLDALIERIARHVAQPAAAVAVPFDATAPVIDDAAARTAADEVRLMLSQPIAVRVRGESAGTLAPGQLARLLTFREHGKRLVVVPDAQKLARVLDPRVAPYKRQARNAQIVVEGDRVRVAPSQEGVAIDVRATAVNVNTAAHGADDRTAEVALAAIAPDLTTQDARALGITERVSSFTTDMGVSSANRIHNVQLMADYIDGTIIRPGERFSFNDAVGPRTPERGFLEGQMIVGSLLLPSIGGGVCQTATTLFNNAFELGLPIVERHNHSFYISHYPLGRDATVAWGGPDFVFENDMRSALLIKASYTSETLTFTFYGTDEGRNVESRTGPQLNWKEPKTTYALDPAAPPGSVRYVTGDHQRGFDVTVHRTVTRDGSVLRNDSFTSKYIAVGDTAVYGPGSSIPRPYFVIPTT